MTQKQPLDDIGGVTDLATYRLSVAKEDLADAETAREVVDLVEAYLQTAT